LNGAIEPPDDVLINRSSTVTSRRPTVPLMSSFSSVPEGTKTIAYALVISFAHLLKLLVVDVVTFVKQCTSGRSTAQTMTEFYSGKVVIVTGASSGIGASLVQTLASIPGTILVISSRTVEKLEEVASMCRLQHPTARIFAVPLDLENFEGVDVYTAKVLDTLRRNGLPQQIDVLINNAGVSSRGAAMETSMATLQKIMRVNFYGPVALSQSVAEHMVTNGGGAIGVVSSVQGKLGIPWRTSYAASKHALQGYFDGFRAELAGKAVSVTIVSPGYVRTSLSLNALNADGSKYNKMDDTTAGGMEPVAVAEKILVSIARKDTDVVLADAKTTAAVQMKAMLPDVIAWIMMKRART